MRLPRLFRKKLKKGFDELEQFWITQIVTGNAADGRTEKQNIKT